ncbi:uncharacterized protein METZ01_LOCUS215719, partial [marine metagenome]
TKSTSSGRTAATPKRTRTTHATF